MSTDPRSVLALGGNALGNTPQEQLERVRDTAKALIEMIMHDNEIIVTHGNGPQVGMIQKAFSVASQTDQKIPSMPLPECGAMSQGYIGYHLQQALQNEIKRRGKQWHVSSLVTQIEVDPADPAFNNPTKPVGAFLTEEQMKKASQESPDLKFVEDSGRGWRQVVASPAPLRIVEKPSILNLLDSEFIVICSGGGGVPVVSNKDGMLQGVPAVIDKDLAAAVLAEDVGAQTLCLLTAVDRVAINFGTPQQQDLNDLTTAEARKLCKEGQFAPGSMLPKVLAAIRFAESGPGKVAVIGSLQQAAATLAGTAGTRIHA
ncbi:carbamate kinase [Bifidobacterium sp. ESL0769]|uniref:carbamate kinase n=1 Tax=Bifidobacterium sp. ESL0769 TaxID=2983229 RepID=UPI0023FA3F1C|nr:carbamate kinase [Bifidobacterium sp. ESL0769]WEV68065.1 carbamate kinase [Bifidobacterium sp. ESL0769]